MTAKGNVEIEDTLQNYNIFSDNIIYEKNKEIIKTKDNSKVLYNDGREIKADNFEYFKLSNTLNANGNVEIEDSNKNIIIYAQDITYEIDKEKLFTKGSTNQIFNLNIPFSQKM